MGTLYQDILTAVRALRQRPLFTAVVLFCLALGLGSTTAIFSVVKTVLLEPLPVTDAARLAFFWDSFVPVGGERSSYNVTAFNYLEWRERARSVESFGAWQPASVNLTGLDQPERVEAARITASFLTTLGVELHLGRNFLPEEDRPGGPDVALVGYSLWQRLWNGDRGVLGRDLRIDDSVYTVVGVLPPRFTLPFNNQLWVPLRLDAAALGDQLHTFHFLGVVGRLAPGVSLEQAQTEMETIADNLAATYPESHEQWTVEVRPIRQQIVGDLSQQVVFLFVAVAALLLIACANVANLLLAHSLERGRELAVRVALGAGRGQIIGQLLVQSVLLALAGGALGLLLAHLGTAPLVRLSPVQALADFFTNIRVDGPVFAFCFLLALVIGVIFGLAPAIRLSRPNLQCLLKEGGRSGFSRASQRFLNVLVVFEVALAAVLLVSASLVTENMRRLERQDLGFDTKSALTLRISLPASRYEDTASQVAFWNEVLDRVRALPGVVRAGVATDMPLNPRSRVARFSVEGRPPTVEGEILVTGHRLVSPGYLETIGIPLLEGRTIDERDLADSQAVVVVNEEIAQRFWPGENPIGKRLKRGGFDSDNPWITVVGLARTAKEEWERLHEDRQIWYLPYTQHSGVLDVNLVVRTESHPMAHAAAVRDAVLAVDPEQPVYQVETLADHVAEAYAPQRFSTILAAVFAFIGLALAAVGLYGVVAYTVVQQTRELGIRMAMGADRGAVLRLVIGRGLKLVILGLALGFATTFALGRYLSRLLFEVSANHVAAYVLTAVVLVTAALLANLVPARRACRVEPAITLRPE